MKKRHELQATWKAAWKVRTRSLSALVLATVLVLEADASTAQTTAIRSEGTLAAPESRATGDVIRAIQDPHSGQRWLLMRDGDHPGGPGRLLAAGGRPEVSLSNPIAGAASKREFVSPGVSPGFAAIRAGDRVVVEEHTAIADVRLEAVALEPARTGAMLAIRLKIGGRVERAVALAPGRAAFASLPPAAAEGRP